jgi:glucosamine--fructose-6-phosphate aminotransferase (isomerizing)
VETHCATELSGFHLRDDMADTLIVAVSQSGTTTDTNRTVDLVRDRGAAVLSIVNRRHSDLVSKSDGVLYTSDGRDVEMSVASTKAFYAQIAAGVLLAAAIADRACGRRAADHERQTLLSALRRVPEALREILEQRAEQIGQIAAQLAPPQRYWALVGNGPNRVAAEEVRIKLSELCYKSIACDATEDKKHIDLSSEPLIPVHVWASMRKRVSPLLWLTRCMSLRPTTDICFTKCSNGIATSSRTRWRLAPKRMVFRHSKFRGRSR